MSNNKLIKCFACNKEYEHRSYQNTCNDCESIYYNLMQCNIDESLVYNKYQIMVTYDVQVQDHDGYCSDSYNQTEKNYERKFKYPLLKIFTNEDLDDEDNCIDLDNKKLFYYQKRTIGHGNGYCGLGTTYTITKAEVIIKPPAIDLSDDN